MEKFLENYPAVLSVADVAKILGVAESTVRRMIKEKQLVAIKVGRLFRIPKDRLIEYFSMA